MASTKKAVFRRADAEESAVQVQASVVLPIVSDKDTDSEDLLESEKQDLTNEMVKTLDKFDLQSLVHTDNKIDNLAKLISIREYLSAVTLDMRVVLTKEEIKKLDLLKIKLDKFIIKHLLSNKFETLLS